MLAASYATGPSSSPTYSSVESFVKQIKALHPSRTPGDVAELFGIRSGKEGKESRVIFPDSVAGVTVIWKDAGEAVILVTARPEVDGTSAEVGVLFLLDLRKEGWCIAGTQRFETKGKYAQVACELASTVGSAYHLGQQGMEVVVTVRRTSGGRGYSYWASKSYRVSHGDIEIPRFEEFF